jgi:hypothetical protein
MLTVPQRHTAPLISIMLSSDKMHSNHRIQGVTPLQAPNRPAPSEDWALAWLQPAVCLPWWENVVPMPFPKAAVLHPEAHPPPLQAACTETETPRRCRQTNAASWSILGKVNKRLSRIIRATASPLTTSSGKTKNAILHISYICVCVFSLSCSLVRVAYIRDAR